jgi:UDPglucose--hexose-1-phosphate uridylyltransferase
VKRPDFDQLVRESLDAGCPFCPGSVETSTPLYAEEVMPGGRLSHGEALIFPNLLPLDRYSGVCILGRTHFIDPGGFTPEVMGDAFKAVHEFIRAIARHDPETNFFSVNWNYMPPSGSSMMHPHLQVNCGPHPTYQARVQMECSHSYSLKNGRTFWHDYVEAEKRSGERFLREIGPTSWTLGFAPQGALPDMWCIFRDCGSLLEWKDDEREAFVRGLAAALACFDQEGLYSFNVAIFSGRKREGGHFRVNARVTPRVLLREIGNSDQTYTQVLHREPCTLRPPESVRDRAAAVFDGVEE